MVLTKEQKKAKILDYLDKKAKNKEFRVEKFEIYEISKNLNFNESEVIELIEGLSSDGSVKKEKLLFEIYLPEGDYKHIKNEFSGTRYYPLGIEHLPRLLIGAVIAWLLIITSINYTNFLNKINTEPINIFVYLIILVVLIFAIGYIINEIYIRILMKNDYIRDLAVKIKPLVFTAIIIWFIMLVPFGCLYYYWSDEYRVFAIIYFIATIPTTILASIGIQNFLLRNKKDE